MNLLYLVHDLSDPAVARRAAMLRDGGATVTLAGFRRSAEPVPGAIDFGQTFNGGFPQRMLAVIKHILFIKKHRALFAGADFILARNLEMLAIAVAGRGAQPIIYESLDIHRLLLGKGPSGIALRRLEGWLSIRACALITSSPAFIHEYFESRSLVRLPTKLVENKIYPAPAVTLAPRQPGPPWVIGWFGAIRCRKSLDILTQLAKSGYVEIIIRGRPALDQFDDFHHTVSNTPGMRFLGPYQNPGDLETIYREVHFSWAIDMFEEGLNSAWLLPNRLYEGGLYGAVPLALADVETGKTLQRMGIGVLLSQPLLAALADFFTQLTAQQYRILEASVMRLPPSTWSHSRADCEQLIAFMSEAAHG